MATFLFLVFFGMTYFCLSHYTRGRKAARVAAEAYQVIGALSGDTGHFDHPEVQRALDYFGDIANGEKPHRCKEILPWYGVDNES